MQQMAAFACSSVVVEQLGITENEIQHGAVDPRQLGSAEVSRQFDETLSLTF